MVVVAGEQHALDDRVEPVAAHVGHQRRPGSSPSATDCGDLDAGPSQAPREGQRRVERGVGAMVLVNHQRPYGAHVGRHVLGLPPGGQRGPREQRVVEPELDPGHSVQAQLGCRVARQHREVAAGKARVAAADEHHLPPRAAAPHRGGEPVPRTERRERVASGHQLGGRGGPQQPTRVLLPHHRAGRRVDHLAREAVAERRRGHPSGQRARDSRVNRGWQRRQRRRRLNWNHGRHHGNHRNHRHQSGRRPRTHQRDHRHHQRCNTQPSPPHGPIVTPSADIRLHSGQVAPNTGQMTVPTR